MLINHLSMELKEEMRNFRDSFISLITAICIIILAVKLLDFLYNPDPSKAGEIIASTTIPIWIGPIVWVSNHLKGIIAVGLIIFILWMFKVIK